MGVGVDSGVGVGVVDGRMVGVGVVRLLLLVLDASRVGWASTHTIVPILKKITAQMVRVATNIQRSRKNTANLDDWVFPAYLYLGGTSIDSITGRLIASV